jgi:hypothetical protein
MATVPFLERSTFALPNTLNTGKYNDDPPP